MIAYDIVQVLITDLLIETTRGAIVKIRLDKVDATELGILLFRCIISIFYALDVEQLIIVDQL
ncbi:hypothetical protein ACJX0J_022576, partial [Zea mays]